ncbi:MAG TPA: HAMP domain-containing sensor histidine kinase [Caulobacteraceae bacterium]|nr:HAMP domain-containing sensor histidine kinase [Caulobacteraceae bacterium]
MVAADAQIDKRARRAAADWHAVWLLALGACAIAWPAPADSDLTGALAAAAAPGLVAQASRFGTGRLGTALTILAWPLGIGAALALSGGLAGPLAPLAFAPAAAMTVLNDRRFIALGAALTLATIAAAVLAANVGAIDVVPRVGPWLSLTILAIEAVGLAAALQLTRARAVEREAARSDETARLKALLEHNPFLVLRLDSFGVVREAFCGAPEDWDHGLIGQPFETLASDVQRDAARSAVALMRRSGAASVGFAPPAAPDRFLAVELRALENGDGVAVVRDASRERAYEAHLEQARDEAESLAQAKSRFLANMSHELRTPLNAIIGFSDIMRSKLFGPLAERYAEYAGLIHESGGHLLDLINDVLDMSKIEADRFTLTLEPFDAREAVAAALRLTRVQADTAKITLRGALPPHELDVVADRRAIKQIVLNLVSNALKFTPTGGQVNVLARARGPELEIIVADTGVGISPADLERLGKPYEQAGGADQRRQGTGLGLSLVRAFAELHGGSMVIKSVLGEGTAVSVRLPVMDQAFRPPPAPPEPTEPPPRRAAVGDNVVAFSPRA